MINLISPFISVHSETCNTQHVLIEAWRKILGNTLLGLWNFQRPLIVIIKLVVYEFDKNRLCFIYSNLKSKN